MRCHPRSWCRRDSPEAGRCPAIGPARAECQSGGSCRAQEPDESGANRIAGSIASLIMFMIYQDPSRLFGASSGNDQGECDRSGRCRPVVDKLSHDGIGCVQSHTSLLHAKPRRPYLCNLIGRTTGVTNDLDIKSSRALMAGPTLYAWSNFKPLFRDFRRSAKHNA